MRQHDKDRGEGGLDKFLGQNVYNLLSCVFVMFEKSQSAVKPAVSANTSLLIQHLKMELWIEASCEATTQHQHRVF